MSRSQARTNYGGAPILRVLVLVAAASVLAPLGAEAADLVVWWEKGFYPQAGEAVAEIVAAFEQETGKKSRSSSRPRM